MKKIKLLAALLMLLSTMYISNGIAQNSCDTLRNYSLSGQVSALSSPAGLLNGQYLFYDNNNETYTANAWAEPYYTATPSTVKAVRFVPWKIQNNSTTAKLTIVVYSSNNGVPGTIIGSQMVDYNDLQSEDYWSTVVFDNPVSVNGAFFVGYKLPAYDGMSGVVDSFALYSTITTTNYTQLNVVGVNVAYDEWETVSDNFNMGGNPLNSAFVFDVLLSTAPDPVAGFTIRNANACESGFFHVDASTSSGTIDNYSLWLTDLLYTSLYVEKENTAVIDSIQPLNSNLQQQLLLLLTNGACTYDAAGITVNVYPNINATITATDATCTSAGSIAITNASGGNGSYLYSIDGGNTNSPNANYSNLNAGSYDVVVSTNGEGCSYSETKQINTASGAPISVGADQSVCAGKSATITASGNGSIEWFIGAVSQGTGTSLSVSPSSTTTYNAVLTDGNGCKDTKQVTVTVNTVPTVTASVDVQPGCNQSTGSATASANGGSSPYSYNWSNMQSGATATGLNAGNYTVTVTDVKGCTATTNIGLSSIGAPTATASVVNNPGCNLSNGSVTVSANGGSGQFSYSWNTTPASSLQTVVNLPAGSYSVTVTDNVSQCQSVASVTLSAPNSPTATASVVDVPGCNQSNGSAKVVVSGGSGQFSYLWNSTPTSTMETAGNLVAGSYSVTVTDDVSQCQVIASVTLSNPTPPSVSINVDAQPGCNTANGSATATPNGGSGQYSYNWNTTPAQTSATATGLAAGTYTVIVTDNVSQCSTNESITLSPPNPPVATISGANVVCAGSSTTLSASGGVNYEWSSSETTNEITVSPTTNTDYTVTVTDNNGCTATATATVNVQQQPTPSITANGNVLTAGGGTFDSYQWLLDGIEITGATSQSYTATEDGNYTVVVTENTCGGTSVAYPVSGTGIKTINTALAVSLLPNPNNGTFKLVLNDFYTYQVTISNLIGEVILKSDVQKERTFSMNDAPKGVYLVNIKKAGISKTLKFTLVK